MRCTRCHNIIKNKDEAFKECFGAIFVFLCAGCVFTLHKKMTVYINDWKVNNEQTKLDI